MRTKQELSVNTSRSENLANFREAYPTRLARVSPRCGVAQPLKAEARPGFSVGSPRGGRCQPSERGAAEASRGLLECMS